MHPWPQTSPQRFRHVRGWWRVGFLVFAIAGLVILALRPGPPLAPIRAGLEFLPVDRRLQGPPPTWFERRVPLSWAWLWRLRDWWRGPQPGVLLEARFIDCDRIPEDSLAHLLSDRPLAETNGVRAWVLQLATLEYLKTQLEADGGQRLMAPRVQTGHGILSTLSVGSPQPIPGASASFGLALALLPLIRPDGTELQSVLTVTETAAASNQVAEGESGGGGASTRTNLALATRWEVPDGMGFFLLSAGQGGGERRIALIGSVAVQRGRK